MEQKQRTSGFRFSFVDGIVLALTVAVTPWLVTTAGIFGWLPAFVVGHFFLFCNVFRIRRKQELIWAGFFVASTTLLRMWSVNPIWLLILPLPLTVLLIGLEMRHPNYHGILWSRINPRVSEIRVNSAGWDSS